MASAPSSFICAARNDPSNAAWSPRFQRRDIYSFLHRRIQHCLSFRLAFLICRNYRRAATISSRSKLGEGRLEGASTAVPSAEFAASLPGSAFTSFGRKMQAEIFCGSFCVSRLRRLNAAEVAYPKFPEPMLM